MSKSTDMKSELSEEDILAKNESEESLAKNVKLLQAIYEIQSKFIINEKPKELFDRLLGKILTVSESEYGFIGEILFRDDKTPYLKTFALTNIAWSPETQKFYDERAPSGMEFTNLQTLFGAVITSGKTVISNSPSTDPRRGGLPEGHPALNAFLGLPLYRGERLIGVVGLANREGGYDDDLVEYLQPLVATTSNMIEAYNANQNRKLAEEQRAKMEESILKAQKLESLGVLAGGIAHDFNNLLTAILGASELALEDLEKDSPVWELVKEIDDCAKRAADLSRQMLAYSGKGQFVIEVIDLNKILKDVIKLAQSSISKKVEIEYRLADNLPFLEVDLTQIRQVIMNIITNAAEAIGEKTGVISVSTYLKQCDPDCFCRSSFSSEKIPPGMYVYMEISDTGCGMDNNTVDKLFDPFFTTKFVGRGLGMSAVLGIIRGHRGAILVDSQPGMGAKFTVILPFTQKPEAEKVPSKEDPSSAWMGSGVVLLVDDEKVVRDVGRKMLTKLGFDVVEASDGESAIEIFRERFAEINCVLLDLTMPRVDGVECLKNLLEIKNDVRVIVTSGYDEGEVSKLFTTGEMKSFLQKPFEFSTLRRAMKEAFIE